MSRKQVVSLTSAILMVALITNFVGLIQDAEATPLLTIKIFVTHSCVDTDHPSQSDICQTVDFIDWYYMYHGEQDPHQDHDEKYFEESHFKSTHVTSCSQCPNPPFTHYN